MLIFFNSSTLFFHNKKSPDTFHLYYWSPSEENQENFGDYLSFVLIERMMNSKVQVFKGNPFESPSKFLAVGSILHFACENDLVWGSGINGKHLNKKDYNFNHLDVRSVRGPLTRKYLKKKFNINCPKIYGDPCLLFPVFFPEFKKKKNPRYDHIIIPHISEEALFPKNLYSNVVYPSENWQEILKKILDAKLVIASSLHGIILAEAFGIPSRMLRITENEPLFKYKDYYLGTGRKKFQFAKSVAEAISMGGEEPFFCNLQKLYNAFPFENYGKLPDRNIKKTFKKIKYTVN